MQATPPRTAQAPGVHFRMTGAMSLGRGSCGRLSWESFAACLRLVWQASNPKAVLLRHVAMFQENAQVWARAVNRQDSLLLLLLPTMAMASKPSPASLHRERRRSSNVEVEADRTGKRCLGGADQSASPIARCFAAVESLRNCAAATAAFGFARDIANDWKLWIGGLQ